MTAVVTPGKSEALAAIASERQRGSGSELDYRSGSDEITNLDLYLSVRDRAEIADVAIAANPYRGFRLKREVPSTPAIRKTQWCLPGT
jgi:hypothetical protein